jgi:pimeloyl-ACP methyl ester carboxylesterase
MLLRRMQSGDSSGNHCMHTFVLIHGSWHGGWAWESVIRCLSERGHRADAPTLPGHGPEAVRLGITHQDCVASVITYIQQRELKDITLVGHSFGGTVVQRVADQLPDRIGRVVFLDALILDHNECVFDNLPTDYVNVFKALAEASSDNTMLIPWEIWRDNFLQDAPKSVARSFWERLSPEPNRVNLDKLDLRRFYSLDIAKSFIRCRQDRALPPGYFHPRMSSRLGSFKLLEMDGGHEVMFTRPRELADKLIEAAEFRAKRMKILREHLPGL